MPRSASRAAKAPMEISTECSGEHGATSALMERASRLTWCEEHAMRLQSHGNVARRRVMEHQLLYFELDEKIEFAHSRNEENEAIEELSRF